MVKTTFIIDDDEIYIYAIKRLINMCKLSESVMVFTNGRQAIDYFKTSPAEDGLLPDVILLDVRMPIMDGWQFLEAYKEIDIVGKHRVDIYMISSSIDPKDVESAAKIPLIKDYLFKPINLDDLKRIFADRLDDVSTFF